MLLDLPTVKPLLDLPVTLQVMSCARLQVLVGSSLKAEAGSAYFTLATSSTRHQVLAQMVMGQ